jgi:hypothetical protein
LLSKDYCEKCYFNINNCHANDECTHEEKCEYYTPFIEDEDDDNALIEERRLDFYREWNEYITGFYK